MDISKINQGKREHIVGWEFADFVSRELPFSSPTSVTSTSLWFDPKRDYESGVDIAANEREVGSCQYPNDRKREKNCD
jgi:hypothetical protein